MKSRFKNLVLIALIIVGLSFTVSYAVKQNTAEVSQIEGLYVFTDSKPVAEYEYLGTVKVAVGGLSSQYKAIRDKLIKKARKKYPNADGIILDFATGGVDKASVVKFKE